MIRQAPRSRAASQMAASSGKGMVVPVGFDGVATCTALVRSVQAASVVARSSW